MLHHDGVIAIRAGGNQCHRNTGHMLYALKIQTRIHGQFIEFRYADRGLSQAVHRFIDGDASGDVISPHG